MPPRQYTTLADFAAPLPHRHLIHTTTYVLPLTTHDAVGGYTAAIVVQCSARLNDQLHLYTKEVATMQLFSAERLTHMPQRQAQLTTYLNQADHHRSQLAQQLQRWGFLTKKGGVCLAADQIAFSR